MNPLFFFTDREGGVLFAGLMAIVVTYYLVRRLIRRSRSRHCNSKGETISEKWVGTSDAKGSHLKLKIQRRLKCIKCEFEWSVTHTEKREFERCDCGGLLIATEEHNPWFSPSSSEFRCFGCGKEKRSQAFYMNSAI
jgi:hypothetical protein